MAVIYIWMSICVGCTHTAVRIRPDLNNMTLSDAYVFFDLYSAYGSVAYTITPNVASILLRNNLPLGNRLLLVTNLGYLNNKGIDMALSVDYKEINAKISIPPMVVTKNDKNTNTIPVA